MSKVNFSRQQCADLSIRMSLSINGRRVLDHFSEGTEESDPTILWYVDLRAEGNLPERAGAARKWLTAHAQPIASALHSLAKKVKTAKVDAEWPLQTDVAVAAGVKAIVVCFAIRSLPAPALVEIMEDLADNWQDYLNSLEQAKHVSRR